MYVYHTDNKELIIEERNIGSSKNKFTKLVEFHEEVESEIEE